MSVYENCVYTIIHSDTIVDFIKNGENTYIEKKVWRTALNYLNEAKRKNQIMYLLLAPAENVSCLFAYAQIENIEILKDKKSTKVTFSNLKRFTNESIKKTELIKTDGTNVDENYIRTYLLCKTSSIQKYIDSEPSISILDLRKDDFLKPLSKKRFLSDAEVEAIREAEPRIRCFHSAEELDDKVLNDRYSVIDDIGNDIGKKIAEFYSVDLSDTSDPPYWCRIILDYKYIKNEYNEPEFYLRLKPEFLDALAETGYLKDSDISDVSDDNDDNEISENDELLQTEYIEGASKTISANQYERNRDARNACIKHYGAVCYICGFDFKKKYGEVGDGFIHVHHIVPVSEIGKEYVIDCKKDLIPVCPNCHAMLHKKLKNGKTLSVDELKKIVSSPIRP